MYTYRYAYAWPASEVRKEGHDYFARLKRNCADIMLFSNGVRFGKKRTCQNCQKCTRKGI